MSESGVDNSKKVGLALSKVLADTFTVYQKTHGYHWNVTGPNFRGLHLLLEEQYNEIWTSIDEIAERMDAGRKALMLRGVNEAGPYQSPMEDGMQHFHEWYRRVMQED